MSSCIECRIQLLAQLLINALTVHLDLSQKHFCSNATYRACGIGIVGDYFRVGRRPGAIRFLNEYDW
jgi:hypothetical protein